MADPTITSTAPILPASNMEQSVRFYSALGFQSSPYDADYVFLTRDGQDLHLRKAPDLIEGKSPSGVYFYLKTGAAGLEAEFRAAGVHILSPLAPAPGRRLYQERSSFFARTKKLASDPHRSVA